MTLLFAGCGEPPEQQEYVARVDEARLTRAEVESATAALGATPARAREYINTWVTTELLYQEALRRGLAGSAEMRQQFDAMRKRLLVGALLEEELYTTDTSAVSDDAITVFFNSAGDALLLREDVANLSYVLFSNRDVANTFRSSVLRGTSWREALSQVQVDSALRPHVVQAVYRQYVTRSLVYPEEIWKLARTLARDEVSFVVRTDVGYYVVMVHGYKRQGEMPDLEYVRNEIRDRIVVEKRNLHYEQLVAALRARHIVEIRGEPEVSDTSTVMVPQE
jgi:hypothetical protein